MKTLLTIAIASALFAQEADKSIAPVSPENTKVLVDFQTAESNLQQEIRAANAELQLTRRNRTDFVLALCKEAKGDSCALEQDPTNQSRIVLRITKPIETKK